MSVMTRGSETKVVGRRECALYLSIDLGFVAPHHGHWQTPVNVLGQSFEEQNVWLLFRRLLTLSYLCELIMRLTSVLFRTQ